MSSLKSVENALREAIRHLEGVASQTSDPRFEPFHNKIYELANKIESLVAPNGDLQQLIHQRTVIEKSHRVAAPISTRTPSTRQGSQTPSHKQIPRQTKSPISTPQSAPPNKQPIELVYCKCGKLIARRFMNEHLRGQCAETAKRRRRKRKKKSSQESAKTASTTTFRASPPAAVSAPPHDVTLPTQETASQAYDRRSSEHPHAGTRGPDGRFIQDPTPTCDNYGEESGP